MQGRQTKDISKNMKTSYPQPNNRTASGDGQDASPCPPHAKGGMKGVPGPSCPPPFVGGPVGGTGGWAVDAACSGNPGPMEYQCVDLQTGERVFHFGPMHGTNNIGEFLAIVHALALLERRGVTDKAIYSDSYNAILWVRKKQCKTKLERNATTEPLYQIIARAEQWLRTHTVTTPIIKWETKLWGEIPADFGNKK